MSPPTFEHRFEVRLHDTDAAGVLFYAHLFRHSHDAYESLLDSLGLPLAALIEGDRGRTPLRIPIVQAQAEYLAPIRLGERIDVRLDVLEVRRRSFSIGYRFQDRSGQVRATARTVHCSVATPGTGQPLPEYLASALKSCIGPSLKN
jgi:1,4-dihydroxy-2-naphthoyl-CoA hydrolase